MQKEMGKIFLECEVEIERSIFTLKAFYHIAKFPPFQIFQQNIQNKRLEILKIPLEVLGVITPFNHPLNILLQIILLAIAIGNRIFWRGGNAIVIIKDRKRGLELPGVWLNHGESLSDGVRRKFEDETGFKFHFVERENRNWSKYIAFAKSDLNTLLFQEAQHIELIKLALAWAKMSEE